MYLAIQNFKYGLDTRRIELTTQPGALSTLNNAVINQGGEVVKRKAFERTALPASTFGLQSTPAGLVVFGSIATPGGLPTGVIYVRCQHPDGSTAMTGVKSSRTFGLYAFALCSFADGSVYAYYNGAFVKDFTSGLITAYLAGNNTLIAAHLSALLNATDFVSSSSSSNVSTLTAPSGASLTLATTKQSTSGVLTGAETQTQVDGITGTLAVGQFTVVAGDKGSTATVSRARATNVATLNIGAHLFNVNDKVVVSGFSGGAAGYNSASATLTAVDQVTGTITYANTGSDEGTTADATGGVSMVAYVSSIKVGTTELLSGSVNYSLSPEVTAAALKDAINAGPAVTTYTATVIDETVYIAAVALGTTANDKAVSVTVVGAICIGQYSSAIVMSSDPSASAPTVTFVYINGIDYLGGTVSTGVNLEDTAHKAASQVRANGASLYTAVAVGNTLYLSKLITTSSDTPLAVMILTGNKGGVSTTPTDVVSLSVGPPGATFFSPTTNFLTTFVSGAAVTANATGGTPAYSYVWSIPTITGGVQDFTSGTATLNNGLVKVEFMTNNQASTQLKFTTVAKRSFSGYVACTVTDSVGRKATEFLQLDVQFYDNGF